MTKNFNGIHKRKGYQVFILHNIVLKPTKIYRRLGVWKPQSFPCNTSPIKSNHSNMLIPLEFATCLLSIGSIFYGDNVHIYFTHIVLEKKFTWPCYMFYPLQTLSNRSQRTEGNCKWCLFLPMIAYYHGNSMQEMATNKKQNHPILTKITFK